MAISKGFQQPLAKVKATVETRLTAYLRGKAGSARRKEREERQRQYEEEERQPPWPRPS